MGLEQSVQVAVRGQTLQGQGATAGGLAFTSRAMGGHCRFSRGMLMSDLQLRGFFWGNRVDMGRPPRWAPLSR